MERPQVICKHCGKVYDQIMAKEPNTIELIINNHSVFDATCSCGGKTRLIVSFRPLTEEEWMEDLSQQAAVDNTKSMIADFLGKEDPDA